MANVTYLLGAGASANCLPTYLNFFERFEKFKTVFQESNQLLRSLDETQKRDAQSIRGAIIRISEEFQFHNTPDTIAKKYFHASTDSSNLTELKKILILFFLYEQIAIQRDEGKKQGDPGFKQSLDKRYDAFIASLLKPIRGKLRLYDQFKILTWNYDLQFEIAYSRYEDQNIPYCQRKLQSYPLIAPEGNEKFDPNKFGVIHLNGIAYARQDSFRGYTDYVGTFLDNEQFVLQHLTNVYHAMNTIGIPGEIGGSKLLSFAWEKQKEDSSLVQNELFKNALLITEKTEILVIIGYSFPIFNNPIDKMLLQNMSNLKKIYIQSPNANEIKRLLMGDLLTNINIPDSNIVDVGYWSQFYIPLEWDSKKVEGIPFEFR